MKAKAMWVALGLLGLLGLLAIAGSSVSADLALAQAALGEGASGLVLFLGVALVLTTGSTVVLGLLCLWLGWLIYKERMVRGEAKRRREAWEHRKPIEKKVDPIEKMMETQARMQMMDMMNRMNRRD